VAKRCEERPRLLLISDDSIYQKYRYMVFDIDISYGRKKYRIFRFITVFKNNIAIFFTDSLLRCVTGKKDYKWAELMVS